MPNIPPVCTYQKCNVERPLTFGFNWIFRGLRWFLQLSQWPHQRFHPSPPWSVKHCVSWPVFPCRKVCLRSSLVFIFRPFLLYETSLFIPSILFCPCNFQLLYFLFFLFQLRFSTCETSNYTEVTVILTSVTCHLVFGSTRTCKSAIWVMKKTIVKYSTEHAPKPNYCLSPT